MEFDPTKPIVLIDDIEDAFNNPFALASMMLGRVIFDGANPSGKFKEYEGMNYVLLVESDMFDAEVPCLADTDGFVIPYSNHNPAKRCRTAPANAEELQLSAQDVIEYLHPHSGLPNDLTEEQAQPLIHALIQILTRPNWWPEYLDQAVLETRILDCCFHNAAEPQRHMAVAAFQSYAAANAQQRAALDQLVQRGLAPRDPP